MPHLLEKMNIVPAIMPVALGTAANNGDWVNVENYGRIAIVFLGGVGAASQDPTITVLQAKTNSGGSSKALNFTRIDYKQASALTAVGTFTQVTQAAANTYTEATMGETQKLIVIDIEVNSIDADNDFDYVQASIADPGTATQLGAVLYILHEPRYVSGLTGYPPEAIA